MREPPIMEGARKPLRRWTLERVAEVTEAEWRLPARLSVTEVEPKFAMGAALDSRALKPGEVFVPLPGTRVDGHDFIAEARAHGAIASFCRSERADAIDGEAAGPLLLVEDPEQALQQWGQARREDWTGTAIGITGSNGKTTTKELVAACLATRGPTHATAGNRNNQLGVPVTLTGLSDDHVFAVIEMGMNHRGEIARLAEWSRPSIGIITHVGAAHLEGLGSLEEVARAKVELALALPAEGLLVTPAGEPALEAAIAEAGITARRLTFALEGDADLVPERVGDLGPAGTSFRVAGFPPIRLRLAGRHNVSNALAALLCARELGLDPDAVAAALAAVNPPPGRMEVAVAGGVTLLLDHYNANPASMRAALDALRRWPARRRYAAFGEMKELGDYTVAGHREVGEAATFLDGLYWIGEATAHVAEGAIAAGLKEERVRGFPTTGELAEAMAETLSQGDVVLIKGSRASRMEDVASALRERLHRRAPANASGGEGS